MTAEIAILNKASVALAADSAVTVEYGRYDGAVSKIYNSFDKIFLISKELPVAIMVYGGAQVASIPIETLIEEFRRGTNIHGCAHLSHYVNEFKNHISIKSKTSSQQYDVIIQKQVLGILSIAEERIISILLKEERYNHDIASDKIIDVVLKEFGIGLHYINQNSRRDPREQNEEDLRRQRQYLREAIDSTRELFEKLFNKMLACTDADRLVERAIGSTSPLIRDYVSAASASTLLTSEPAGFVFAGFGPEDTFPSLYSFEVAAIINGEIKELGAPRECKITPGKCEAGIEAFAETEMVERFLTGVDPVTMNYIESLVESYIVGFSEELIERHGKKSRREEARQDVQFRKGRFTKEAMKRIFTFNQARKDEILNIVKYMPKDALSNTAESLVNLTLANMRVSTRRETVAGPVDVAILSKADGFQWIRNKHNL